VANWPPHWVVVLVGDLSDDIITSSTMTDQLNCIYCTHIRSPGLLTSLYTYPTPQLLSTSTFLSLGNLALPAGGCDLPVCYFYCFPGILADTLGGPLCECLNDDNPTTSGQHPTQHAVNSNLPQLLHLYTSNSTSYSIDLFPQELCRLRSPCLASRRL
jgi:hypothetical protein